MLASEDTVSAFFLMFVKTQEDSNEVLSHLHSIIII